MAGTLRQAMVFLGLADDGYDQPQDAPQRRTAGSGRAEDATAPARSSARSGSTPAAERSRRTAAPALDDELDTDAHLLVVEEEATERGGRGLRTGSERSAHEPSDEAARPARSRGQAGRPHSSREGSHAIGEHRPAALEARRREAAAREESRSEAHSGELSAPGRGPDESEHRAPVTPIHRAAAPTESDNELRRITTIHPRSYNDAKVIGESFRENIPVIMNVTDMDVAEAKRLVDFSSGLTFALNGSIERVTEQVFLLTPANLEVLATEDLVAPEHDALEDHPLFDQR